MYTFLGSLESQIVPINQIQTRVIVGINIDGGATVAANVVDTGATDILIAHRNLGYTRQYRTLKDVFFKIEPLCVNEGVVNSFACGKADSQVVEFTHTFKKPLIVSLRISVTPVSMTLAATVAPPSMLIPTTTLV